MRFIRFFLIAAAVVSLTGCEVVNPRPIVSDLSTPAPVPTSALPPTQTAPSPTATLVPTPAPSATPLPTDTPLPTATPAVTPTPEGYVYVFPVQPPSVTNYVDYHHDYPANDILAPLGTLVVAVTNGVIDEVNYTDRWDPATDDPAWRGGLFISIIGDDGIRYYGSHLNSLVPGLEAGQRVRAGQPLGTIGQSGDAAGTDPHLHFGISHPTFPGDWSIRRGEIDPYPYLQAWQEGQSVTPVLDEGGQSCSTGMLALPPAPQHAKERIARYGRPFGLYPAGAEGSQPTQWTIGHSVNGHPIDVYRFGEGSARIAIVGGLESRAGGPVSISYRHTIVGFPDRQTTLTARRCRCRS